MAAMLVQKLTTWSEQITWGQKLCRGKSKTVPFRFTAPRTRQEKYTARLPGRCTAHRRPKGGAAEHPMIWTSTRAQGLEVGRAASAEARPRSAETGQTGGVWGRCSPCRTAKRVAKAESISKRMFLCPIYLRHARFSEDVQDH